MHDPACAGAPTRNGPERGLGAVVWTARHSPEPPPAVVCRDDDQEIMFVGVCRLTLRVVQSHSLKEKRAVLRRLRDRAAEAGVTLREVGGADTWQRAELGFAVVGQDRDEATAAVRRVVALCAQADGGEVTAVREEVLGFGEDWFAAAAPYGKPEDADADAAWIPTAWREEDGTP